MGTGTGPSSEISFAWDGTEPVPIFSQALSSVRPEADPWDTEERGMAGQAQASTRVGTGKEAESRQRPVLGTDGRPCWGALGG
jgi:hypothetical protein